MVEETLVLEDRPNVIGHELAVDGTEFEVISVDRLIHAGLRLGAARRAPQEIIRLTGDFFNDARQVQAGNMTMVSEEPNGRKQLEE